LNLYYRLFPALNFLTGEYIVAAGLLDEKNGCHSIMKCKLVMSLISMHSITSVNDLLSRSSTTWILNLC